MKTRVNFLLALFLMMGAAGCTVAPELIIPGCPPAETPRCEPGSFGQVLLDTTYRGARLPYVHIVRLSYPTNSSTNDYTYREFSKLDAVITTSDRIGAMNLSSRGPQKLFWSPTHGADSKAPMKEIAGDLPGAYGSGFYVERTGEYFFSAKSDGDDPNDFELYVGRLVRSGSGIALEEVNAIGALNLPQFFDSQPALSADGKTLYFVSDREGGSGGTDVWMASRADIAAQNWSKPIPLRGEVNTACDELTPFLVGDTLYFASNGHATVGGYDLFRSVVSAGNSGPASNLGKPINTMSDEIFPSTSSGRFYYSSNQLRENDFDLYTVTSSLSVIAAVAPEPQPEPIRHVIDSVRIHGEVTRGETGYPAREAEVFVQNNRAEELLRQKVDTAGRFELSLKTGDEYNIGAESDDAFFDLKHVDLRNPSDSEYAMSLHLPDTLVLRINFPFDDYLHPYDFVMGDDGQPTGITWQNSLDRATHSIMQALPRLKKLIVTGHTDSLGSDAYNDRLGDRRAKFVKSELEKRGVPASIISVETGGRRHPLAIRPGEFDEAYRLRNRRVEFVKVYK